MKKWILYVLLGMFLASPSYAAAKSNNAHYTATQESQESITPEQALKNLIEGNKRFVNNNPIQRNLLRQAKTTSVKGQFPSAVILSCMDSRGSSELIFDQGFGDIFSIRVAGNVVDIDQLGGLEFATKLVGSKLIVILGHTQCGAVAGACKGAKLGNLTELLNKIQPAVQKIKKESNGKIDCTDANTVDAIAKQNVLDMMAQVKENSPVIRDLVQNQKVLVVGAMHHLATGEVTFFDENGKELR